MGNDWRMHPLLSLQICLSERGAAGGGGLGAGAEEGGGGGESRCLSSHRCLRARGGTCSQAALDSRVFHLLARSVLYRSAARDKTAVTCRRKLAEYGHSVNVDARRVTNRVLIRVHRPPQPPVRTGYGPAAAGALGGAAHWRGVISSLQIKVGWSQRPKASLNKCSGPAQGGARHDRKW